MKRFLIIFGAFIFSNLASFAGCNYECVAPYDMNGSVNSFFSKITGANVTTEQVAEIALKKEIEKILKSDKLSVDITSFSSKDLKNGIFKSAHVRGTNVNINDIYVSYVDLKTLCEFNYIKEINKQIVFKEDLPLSFDIKMSASDLNKTMNTSNYKKVVKDVNRIIEKFGGVQVSSTKVSIKSNKIYYTIGISFPFVKGEKTIDITSNLGVQNGKIKFTDAKFTSNIFKMDLKKIDFLLKYLNPLDFSIEILDNKNVRVNVQSVEIKDNMINAKGVAVVNKD